jgi:hypothetical protein
MPLNAELMGGSCAAATCVSSEQVNGYLRPEGRRAFCHAGQQLAVEGDGAVEVQDEMTKLQCVAAGDVDGGQWCFHIEGQFLLCWLGASEVIIFKMRRLSISNAAE